jgi:Flp pilus assembly protein TadG
MTRSLSGRAVRRADARWWRRTRRQSVADRRKRQRGQSLIIFAVSLTVLMGLSGLAVDVLRAYDLYARAQRAAESGALAGVLYMPNYYNTLYTSSKGSTYSAITRALAETQRAGFGVGEATPPACTGADTSKEVTVCTNPSLSPAGTALQVTITEPISVFFLSLVGIQSFNVTATSAADYLPPVNLGSQSPSLTTTSYFSDGGECNNKPSPPPSCSGGINAFSAAINGPAELKEQGDPYVNCEEGPSYTTTPDPSAAVPPYVNVPTGLITNHPQNGAPLCGANSPGGNPDEQPGGFGGPMTTGTTHPGGYNYGIHAPTSPVSVWIFNPSFIPNDPSSCQGFQVPDQFFTNTDCSGYYVNYPPVSPVAPGVLFDDPRLYFQVTYTMYQVTTVYDRSGDIQYVNGPSPKEFSGLPFTPYDQMTNDLVKHGCQTNGSYVYQLPTTSGGLGSCVSSSSVSQYDWIKLADNIGPTAQDKQGIWRLVVESTAYNPWNDSKCGLFSCGWGMHAYGIKLCPAKYNQNSGIDNCVAPSDATVNPWNNMTIDLTFQNSSFTNQIPLADLPAAFAGRTITINVFDPGDTHGHGGNSYMALLPPATGDNGQANPPMKVQYQSPSGTAWERVVPFPGSPGAGVDSVYTSANATGQTNSDNIYNGLWVTAQVTLPSDYQGGQWWLNFFHDQGKDFDEVCISISLNGGSPVHIIL